MCDPNKQCTCDADVNTAMSRNLAAETQCMPHVYMRPSLVRYGIMWGAFYGPSIEEGVCGFGETPEKAMQAFDDKWRTDFATNPAKP